MAQDYKIKWYGKIVFDKATEVNVRAMKKSAALVEGYAKQSVKKAGTGRLVTRYRPRTPGGKVSKYQHRVSAPGKPPALDMGNLMNSIQSRVTVGAAIVKGEVGSDIDYALYLEIGTSKMAARPFLRPAVTANRRKINRIFREANS